MAPRLPLPAGLRAWFAEQRSEAVRHGWERVQLWGAVGAHSRRARRFGSFGHGSFLAFPWNTLYGERYMRIGADTYIGPGVTDA